MEKERIDMSNIILTCIVVLGIFIALGIFVFEEKDGDIFSKSVIFALGAALGDVVSAFIFYKWMGELEGLIVGAGAFICFTIVVCTGFIISHMNKK